MLNKLSLITRTGGIDCRVVESVKKKWSVLGVLQATISAMRVRYSASEWLGETLLSVDPPLAFVMSNQYAVCLPCCSSKLVIKLWEVLHLALRRQFTA